MESEGKRNAAYLDAVGVPTVGYGHTGPEVHLGLTWTDQQCEDVLFRDLEAAGVAVTRLVKVSLNQNQFDSLTDFCFNLGAAALAESTLLRKLNMGLYTEIPAEMERWVRAGGEVLPGLVVRRQKEIDLWNAPES